MLVRLALGTVAWWEIVVTIVLMLLTILASIWFAARLYRWASCCTGKSPVCDNWRASCGQNKTRGNAPVGAPRSQPITRTNLTYEYTSLRRPQGA